MSEAFFPGSFDPPTLGHINIIKRAAKLYKKFHVVIASNPSKQSLFSAQERYELLVELTKPFGNVEVHIWNDLIVSFAKKQNVSLMIRGVRALADFEYEFELAMTNKLLYPELEILFMPTDPKYFVLRSSAIKEIAQFGGNIETMVPKTVAKAILEKMKI